MIRTILVDDHELIREGLKKILASNPDILICAEAKDWAELFTFLRLRKIDLVILDISLPDKDGIEIIENIKNVYPDIKVLVLTMHPDEKFAKRAFKAGASGYITKQKAADELLNAINVVIKNKIFVSEEFAKQLADEIIEKKEKPIHELLSNREYEVMLKLIKGKTLSQIAEDLFVSINTVASYKSRVYEKMNITSKYELIDYAIKHHLFE